MELKLDNKKVYAVALEGGGAKGAYEVGAWKALEEAGVKYNAVSGSLRRRSQRGHDGHARHGQGLKAGWI